MAAIRVTDGELHVGDTIHVVGHTSDSKQAIDSMQVNHAPVPIAKPGDEIGIRAADHAPEHNQVFEIVPD